MKSTETFVGQKEVRCQNCKKLLAKGDIFHNKLEVKCVRCGVINSIFKEVGNQVVVTDPNGKILYVNSILEKATGYTASEVIGKTPAVWGKQMPKKFYKKLWDTIKKEKKSIAIKILNRRKDGSVYSAMLRITPVFDTDDNIALFIGMETICV